MAVAKRVVGLSLILSVSCISKETQNLRLSAEGNRQCVTWFSRSRASASLAFSRRIIVPKRTVSPLSLSLPQSKAPPHLPQPPLSTLIFLRTPPIFIGGHYLGSLQRADPVHLRRRGGGPAAVPDVLLDVPFLGLSPRLYLYAAHIPITPQIWAQKPSTAPNKKRPPHSIPHAFHIAVFAKDEPPPVFVSCALAAFETLPFSPSPSPHLLLAPLACQSVHHGGKTLPRTTTLK